MTANIESRLRALIETHDPDSAAKRLLLEAADAIRDLQKERNEARLQAETAPLDMWGHPIGDIRAALNMIEEHTGTNILLAGVKRLSMVLRGQRNLISEQSYANGKLTAENADLRSEWSGLQTIREGLHRELNRLREENASMARYARHLPPCDHDHCTCGLDAARARWAGADGGKRT